MWILLLGLGLALVGYPKVSHGFVPLTQDTGFESLGRVNMVWREAEEVIPFMIHSAGSDDLPAGEVQRVLRESFAVWEQVPGTRVRFEDQGETDSLDPDMDDGVNLVIFDETGRWYSPPPEAGIVAVTFSIANRFTGKMIDADIIFDGRNNRFAVGDSIPPGYVSLKATAIHEIGHLIGLDHSPIHGPPETRPTMNPYVFVDGLNEQVSLEPDDQAGAAFLYPEPGFLESSATISGRVRDVRDSLLVGAHVIAQNLETEALYSTLTFADEEAEDRGHYILRGLPPGEYRLQLEPILPPIAEWNFNLGYVHSEFDKDFPGEFYDNVLRPEHARVLMVGEGEVLTGVDFVSGFAFPGYPVLTPLADLGNTPDAQGPYVVRVRAEDAVDGRLRYWTSTGADTVEVPLTETAEEMHEGRIPGQPVGTEVRYQIEVANTEGEQTWYPHREVWQNFAVVGLSGKLLAFAVLSGSDAVGVIDTGTEEVVARIPIGQYPLQILPGPSGERLYVTNLDSDEISVLSTETFQVVDRIETVAQPLDMALTADGETLYVTNSAASAVTVVDLISGDTRLLRLERRQNGPYGVAVGTGGDLYVADLERSQVVALDPDGQVLARIPVQEPRSLAFSADGRWLYATSIRGNLFSIIDPQRNQVDATVSLPVSGTFAVAPGPDGRKVYLTAQDDGLLVVVDAVERRLLKTIPVGTNPRAIAFSPGGDRAFVTSAGSDEIRVLDTAADTVVTRYAAEGGPRGIALVPAPGFSTAVVGAAALPGTFYLAHSFPNPFNASTQILYELPDGGALPVELVVYNVIGQRVRTLVDQRQVAGRYRIVWSGRDDAGRELGSGVYLARLRIPGREAVQKMLLVR